ncbi:hypothetical protein GCM10023161_03150 [Mycobacterium paraffinicum]|uniref:Uncharacterized protein n=1 Tax=Mycobacterium paraffinicum TaxID=53378 RepID=A0ABP8RAR0_9MYCO
MMLRCSTDMIARGHNADRTMVAALGGPLRGRKAARTQPREPARLDSAAVTSAPYTGARPENQAGQYVSVPGSLPLLT